MIAFEQKLNDHRQLFDLIDEQISSQEEQILRLNQLNIEDKMAELESQIEDTKSKAMNQKSEMQIQENTENVS